jgi:hypothetical protein
MTYVITNAMAPAASTSLAASAASIEGEFSADQSGFSVAGIDDIDGDGVGEVWVGAPEFESSGTELGAAYLLIGPISGAISLSDANLRITGEGGGNVGVQVAGVGDIDADGIPDLAATATQNDEAGTNAGAVFIQLGSGL